MTRGLIASVGLHVGILAAAWFGPSPKPFHWDPDQPHVVELVASAAQLPAIPDPAPRIPREKEAPRLDPPVQEPVPEVAPEKPAPAVEKPTVEPPPVRPRPVERPPRKFQRVAPKRTDDGPSLQERLQQRLEQVEAQEEASATPPPAEKVGERPEESAAATASAEVEATDFPFAWYLNQVQTRVRDAWDTPGDRLLSGLSKPVAVAFVIHRDGHVSDVRVESPSGIPGLDASALRAVERAQPFPPLPDPYEDDALSLTIRFRVSGKRP